MVIRHPKTQTAISLLHTAADDKVHIFAHQGLQGVSGKSPCGMSRVHHRDPKPHQDQMCDTCVKASEQWAKRGKLDTQS